MVLVVDVVVVGMVVVVVMVVVVATVLVLGTVVVLGAMLEVVTALVVVVAGGGSCRSTNGNPAMTSVACRGAWLAATVYCTAPGPAAPDAG